MKEIFLVAALLSCLPSNSYSKPGDSVDSGRMRRNSSVDAGVAGELKFHPLYERVQLGSQTEDDHFTDYGPFHNKSKSILKIEMNHLGGADRDGLVGFVNDVAVARNSRHIAFVVMPGEKFSFSAKDHANISAYSTDIRNSSIDVGLPSERDFLFPTGKYVKCFTQVPVMQLENGEWIYSTYYAYEPRGMSDSSFKPAIPLWMGYLLGPKPPFDAACEKYDA